jgi:hypothetical protein
MTLLQGHGITPALAIKIYRHNGEQALGWCSSSPTVWPMRFLDRVFDGR